MDNPYSKNTPFSTFKPEHLRIKLNIILDNITFITHKKDTEVKIIKVINFIVIITINSNNTNKI